MCGAKREDEEKRNGGFPPCAGRKTVPWRGRSLCGGGETPRERFGEVRVLRTFPVHDHLSFVDDVASTAHCSTRHFPFVTVCFSSMRLLLWRNRSGGEGENMVLSKVDIYHSDARKEQKTWNCTNSKSTAA
jgi:hypothetical protein